MPFLAPLQAVLVYGHWKAVLECDLLKEIGDPVVAEILLDGTRRTGGSTSFLEVHGEIKTISTHDGVQMSGDSTGIRNRIRTFDTDRIIAGQTPKGGCLWEEA